MRRSVLATAAVLCISLFFASSAWALCSQADLTGNWRIYVSGSDNFGSFWTRCTIRIGSTGNVVVGSGSLCLTDEGEQFGLTGGTLTLRSASACWVSGTVNTPNGTNRVRDAGLDRGKTVISGVGIDPVGERFSFTGVKR